MDVSVSVKTEPLHHVNLGKFVDIFITMLLPQNVIEKERSRNLSVTHSSEIEIFHNLLSICRLQCFIFLSYHSKFMPSRGTILS